MHSFPVIVHLDIFKDFMSCFVSRFKSESVDFFNFQRVKEALSDSIIPTVAFTTHTWDHLILLEQYLIISAGILTASI